MARRGPQDTMEIIIVLVCLGFLFFGNLDRISKTYFYNPNYPYYHKYPDFPLIDVAAYLFSELRQ